MRRFICVVLALLSSCSVAYASEVPVVSAKSVVLMDADSGRVLYGLNEKEPRLIASTTKLMTALVALESGHELDEIVTIKPEWTGIEGSSLYLKTGEKIKFETLLYGLLLSSGNDAAHAIAGFCSGDVKSFVRSMNDKAHELGMKNTSFENPSGLNAEMHYSSSYDMALLARACLQNHTLRSIVSTRSITLEKRIFTNHNKLLWQYEGCIGLKTGYTQKAGRTLVTAAQRDEMTLICVTLDDPNDWCDHAALLDYGFENFERKNLIRSGELVCTIPLQESLIPLLKIRPDKDIYAVIEKNDVLFQKIEFNEANISLPAVKGDVIGKILFYLNDQKIQELELKIPYNIISNIAPAKIGIERIFGR